MSYDAVGLRTFIRESLGLPLHSVRPANSEVASGGADQPLVTVLEVSEATDTVSVYEQASLGTQVISDARSHPTIALSLQFFREGAIQNAKKLKALLRHPLSNDRLMLLGLGFAGASEVLNLTGVFNSTVVEERAQLNVTFYNVESTPLTTESFSLVPVNLNLDGVLSINEVPAP